MAKVTTTVETTYGEGHARIHVTEVTTGKAATQVTGLMIGLPDGEQGTNWVSVPLQKVGLKKVDAETILLELSAAINEALAALPVQLGSLVD